MDTSPRSSTTTVSTSDSRTVDSPVQSSRFPLHAKTSSAMHEATDAFPSHFVPNHESNQDSTDISHDRKQSIPYCELEKREREKLEKEHHDELEHERLSKRTSNDTHLNAHSECGRHSDDWLFGGASVVGAVKWLLGRK
ncbi:hypothetical protein EG329_008245 [Mollisiaceae sp. DMI_Dod_QoI]|nr:hypothetical protein EG329_008245 [Helotiales sp. DMI_Dod_QoI]